MENLELANFSQFWRLLFFAKCFQYILETPPTLDKEKKKCSNLLRTGWGPQDVMHSVKNKMGNVLYWGNCIPWYKNAFLLLCHHSEACVSLSQDQEHWMGRVDYDTVLTSRWFSSSVICIETSTLSFLSMWCGAALKRTLPRNYLKWQWWLSE